MNIQKLLPGTQYLPLQAVLIVPFTLQVLVAVGLTGYLSIRNGQKAVADLAQQLMIDIAQQVDRELNNHLEIPHQINRINADAVDLGILDISWQNNSLVAQYFIQQLQQFEDIVWLTLATEDPNYVDASRRETDYQFTWWRSDQPGELGTVDFIAKVQGDTFEVIESTTSPDYDHRQRPWYQLGKESGQSSTFWSDIFVTTKPQQLNLDASQVLYDDNGKFYGLLSTVLSNPLAPLGFSILEAENGQAGLELLRSQAPDLVITDVVMPKMDGLEFLHHIRNTEKFKNTKVFVSSASVAQSDQQMALHYGGNDFLEKPVDANVLFDLLATHLNLTWTYQTQGNTIEQDDLPLTDDVVFPRPILEELLEFAQLNRVKALRSRIEELKASNSTYTAFADSLLQLARQFQTEEIEERLHHHLTED